MTKTGDRKTFTLDLADVGVSKDVQFIFVQDVGFVADRNVCVNISYDKLEECGYVTGKKLTLDGKEYLCRILLNTEWDDIIGYSDSEDVWHWEEAYSWVRSIEYERAHRSNCVIRGYSGASSWNGNAPSSAYAPFGLRPVLVALNYDILNSDNRKFSECANCGGEIEGSYWYDGEDAYCSQECACEANGIEDFDNTCEPVLLPCPHCGDEVYIEQDAVRQKHSIFCEKCDSMWGKFDSEGQATTAWNRRTSQ